MSARVSEKR